MPIFPDPQAAPPWQAPTQALDLRGNKRGHITIKPNADICAIALLTGTNPETLITRWILDGIRTFKENCK